MIVKNEAELLARCLKSVRPVADEIVVVDTGSNDSTVQVAAKCGAKVIQVEWRDDFSWARNISLENASGKWILWLDADDVVPETSLQHIEKLKKRKPDMVLGFVVRNERPGNTGTEFVQARMFPNRRNIFFERRIHEQMMPSALRNGLSMENTDVVVEHHGYADSLTLKSKASRNIKLLLLEYDENIPDAVTAVEIADSYSLIDQEQAAHEWYLKTLNVPEVRNIQPSIAGHAHYGLGNLYNSQEKFESAIYHFNEARQISPWRADVFYSLAVAQELSGDIEGSIKSLKTILVLKPVPGQVGVDFRAARLKTFLRLVRIQVEKKLWNDAESIIKDALSQYPKRPEINNLAGKLYVKLGKYMDALHCFEKSIQIIRQGNAEAYIGLCLVYIAAKASPKAVETLHAIEPFLGNDRRYLVFRKYALNEDINLSDDFDHDSELEKLRRAFFYSF